MCKIQTSEQLVRFCHKMTKVICIVKWKMIEWLGLEGILKEHLVQTPKCIRLASIIAQ